MQTIPEQNPGAGRSPDALPKFTYEAIPWRHLTLYRRISPDPVTDLRQIRVALARIASPRQPSSRKDGSTEQPQGKG